MGSCHKRIHQTKLLSPQSLEKLNWNAISQTFVNWEHILEHLIERLIDSNIWYMWKMDGNRKKLENQGLNTTYP